LLLARVTGLEPATSGVTGRRSNQLSYTRSGRAQAVEPPTAIVKQPPGKAIPARPVTIGFPGEWAVTGSNRRPSRCKRDALPLS
jgi:hypothetical protein